MEETNNEKWGRVQDAIRKHYGKRYAKWYDAWFAGVRFEKYDADARKLTVQIPSRYVYQFLETAGAKVYRDAVHEAFPDCLDLSYRVVPPFDEIAAYMQRQGNELRRNNNRIHLADARQRLADGLRYYIKDKPVQWVQGYDRVVGWLEDNNGKGLLCVGVPGVGKTLICRDILPVLLATPAVSVSAMELRDRLAELKKERIVVIDDLGKEPRKYYGDTDNSFLELLDNAERTGQLLIITTNLATTPTDEPGFTDDILTRYGDAVISRLKSLTRVAVFRGKDMR